MSLRGWPTPYVLFFFSGVSGLVYQVVWVRQFGNVFGNTVHSAALVTAVFMCGLGAGSYLAGAWADRQTARGPRALLAAYGWSEALIGLFGAALAIALPRLAGLSASITSYVRGAHGWNEVAASTEIVRHTLAAVLLAPITLLMGGTLTLLIRFLVQGELSRAGLRIGALYGLNTLGAALGAFLTDFTLVPSLGLLRTQLFSAAINVAAGVLALSFASRLPREAAARAEEPSRAPEEGLRHAVPLVAAAMALSGFAGMGMEIVWFRFLGSSLGPYRSVFSLLLTVILVGMWAGATLGGALHRRVRKPATAYLVAQVLFVLATLALLATFDRGAVDRYLVSAFNARGAPEAGLSRAAQGWAMIRAVAALVALPSIFMGCTFPLANAAVQRLSDRVGRRAGALYLANTAGSVLGSLVAGFLLLPALGAQGSVLVLAIAAGAAVVPLHLSTRKSLGGDEPLGGSDLLFAGGVLVLVTALCSWGMLLPPDHLRRRSLPEPLGERFLTVQEGPSETVAVSVGPSGERRLWTSGHSMSTTWPEAQRYMRAFAHVPLLQMEAPRRVMVICFGVGNTLHAASLHPSVERLDLAELSRNVLDHAGWFSATNRGVLDDPRVSVFVDDGRQHLRVVPPGTYDLITLEPPPISHAGVASLYSTEFYALAKSRLTEGGFLTQWLPVEQIQGPETLAVVRAFVEVFPASVLLSGEGRDLILMGTTRPSPALDAAALARRLAERPRVAEDLAHVDLGRLSELIGTFAAGPDTLRRATAGAAPITDDMPSMEYSVMSKLSSIRVPPEIFDVGGISSFCPGCGPGVPGLEDLAAHLDILGRLYASNAFLHYRTFATSEVVIDPQVVLEGDDGARAGAILRSGYLQRVVGIDPHGLPSPMKPAHLAALATFFEKHPSSAVAALRLGLAHLEGHVPEAETELRRAADLAPSSAPAHLGLALALRRQRRLDDAIAAYRSGLALAPRDVPGHVGLLDVLAVAGREAEIPEELTRILALDPGNGPAHRLLCMVAFQSRDFKGARDHCQIALDNGTAVDGRLLEALSLSR